MPSQDLNRQADLYRVVLPGAESGFRITTVTRLPAGLTTIHRAADPDRTYRLEFTETLAGSAWQRLDVPILISGGQTVAEDPSAAV